MRQNQSANFISTFGLWKNSEAKELNLFLQKRKTSKNLIFDFIESLLILNTKQFQYKKKYCSQIYSIPLCYSRLLQTGEHSKDRLRI